MEYQDRELTCLDCQQPFVFTAGEQAFYDKKGFREEPKRCRPCREARKTRRRGDGMEGLPAGDVGDDDIGNRAERSTRPPRENGRGRSPRPEREMFDATCAQCGQAARVPFRPIAGRPVYCRDCFASRAGAAR